MSPGCPQPRTRRPRRLATYSRPQQKCYGLFVLAIIILVYDRWVLLVCESNWAQAQPLQHLFRNSAFVLAFTILGNMIFVYRKVSLTRHCLQPTSSSIYSDKAPCLSTLIEHLLCHLVTFEMPSNTLSIKELGHSMTPSLWHIKWLPSSLIAISVGALFSVSPVNPTG